MNQALANNKDFSFNNISPFFSQEKKKERIVCKNIYVIAPHYLYYNPKNVFSFSDNRDKQKDEIVLYAIHYLFLLIVQYIYKSTENSKKDCNEVVQKDIQPIFEDLLYDHINDDEKHK